MEDSTFKYMQGILVDTQSEVFVPGRGPLSTIRGSHC